MSSVKLHNINKIYDNNVQAVFDFNLDIKDGEFIVLVGPSGCGKSTTLRMIAGLEAITTGELYINDVLSNDLLPKDRDTAMVFQNYALYPHMSVYENMAFGLKNKKIPVLDENNRETKKYRHYTKEEIDARIEEASNILGIKEYLDRKPKALSGGQCQRVALGRAIVRKANAFLMDEPLSNLDAKLRVQMRSEIIKLHHKLGTITIYVTHDQTEAMTMADRIVIMNKGRIQQIASPKEIYNHPANLFVASFIGTPQMNLLKVELKDNKLYFRDTNTQAILKDSTTEIKDFFLDIPRKYEEKIIDFDKHFLARSEVIEQIEFYQENPNEASKDELDKLIEYKEYLENNHPDRVELVNKLNMLKKVDICNNSKLLLGIRPEDITLVSESCENAFKASVSVVELLGHNQIVHVELFNQEIQLEISAKIDVSIGQEVYLKFDEDCLHLFDEISEDAIY